MSKATGFVFCFVFLLGAFKERKLGCKAPLSYCIWWVDVQHSGIFSQSIHPSFFYYNKLDLLNDVFNVFLALFARKRTKQFRFPCFSPPPKFNLGEVGVGNYIELDFEFWEGGSRKKIAFGLNASDGWTCVNMCTKLEDVKTWLLQETWRKVALSLFYIALFFLQKCVMLCMAVLTAKNTIRMAGWSWKTGRIPVGSG